MKRYIMHVFALLSVLSLTSACNDDNDKIVEMPSNISEVTATPGAGNILLRWTLPSDSNFFYVEVDYKDPKTQKLIKRQISKYADSLLVAGLLMKNGAVDFSLATYSQGGGRGEVFKLSETPNAAPIDTLVHMKQLDLSTKNVTTNAQESSEGDLSNLFDGNGETFFHSQWSGSGPSNPHHLEFDFEDEIEGFKYETKNRHNNGNNAPQKVEFYTSNDKETWSLIRTLDSGMPKESGGSFTSPNIVFNEPSRYMRFVVIKTVNNSANNGQPFFTLGEMKGYSVRLEIIDPEKIE